MIILSYKETKQNKKKKLTYSMTDILTPYWYFHDPTIVAFRTRYEN